MIKTYGLHWSREKVQLGGVSAGESYLDIGNQAASPLTLKSREEFTPCIMILTWFILARRELKIIGYLLVSEIISPIIWRCVGIDSHGLKLGG